MGMNREYFQQTDRIVVESIEGYHLHRNEQVELIFVLEGSINLRIEEETYCLKENDFVVINRYKLHGIFKTKEHNAILRLKIDTQFHDSYFSDSVTKYFLCNATFLDRNLIWSKETPFAGIRQQLAPLIYQWHKEEEASQFAIGTAVWSQSNFLLLDFEGAEETIGKSTKEMERLTRILDYIDANFESGVSLKEIAEIEELNFYYLSTFIKQTLGLSFQEYMNMKRIEKVMDSLVRTNHNITDIAFESGFSTTKSLNQLFKRLLKMTPSEFRGKYISDPEAFAKLDPFELGTNWEKVRPENYPELVEKIHAYL